MASEAKLEELKSKATEAGVGPATLRCDIANVFGFASNSGKDPFERMSDDQCDQLILIYTRHLIEAVGD